MIEERLSVFIPTFNRWSILSKTLARTLSYLPEGFIVRIINNNSFSEGREMVEGVISKYDHVDCEIVDNPVNIGGEANFLRCIEMCETPYVLVLGDDDYLQTDFINNIDFYLRQEQNWGWINFQIKRRYAGMYQGDRLFNNPFELVKSSNNWAELMFISSSVFSISMLRRGLLEGNQWQSVLSVLPLTALKGWESIEQDNSVDVEHKFLLSDREIIDSTGCGDAHYNQVDIYKHLPIVDKVSFQTLDRKRIVNRAVRGSAKYVFKPRVLVKHFYPMVWRQTFSKTFMDYNNVSQGLPYMIGIKAYFYRFYMLTMIILVWSMKISSKILGPVKGIFQYKD